MNQQAWDVIIVGGGPAGAATAIHAARAGRRVALFDAAVFPRQKVCGEYLSAAGWQRLDALGLSELRRQAIPLTTMTLSAGDDCQVALAYGHDLAAPAALSRYVLDEALIDAARQAGVEVVVGRRVRHVLLEGGRAVGIECAGDAEHTPGERFTSRLIVAADGRRSIVVRDTGHVRSRDVGLLGFKRHVRPHNDHFTGISLHSFPGGYVGVCPTEDGSLNLCGVAPRRLLRDAHGHIDTALRDWIGKRKFFAELLAADADGSWHTMPEVSQQEARPHVAGVLYVGDARGTIEPLTGQGMTMALEAARLAGEVLSRCDPDGFNLAEQRAYDRAWDVAFRRSIRTSSWFGGLVRRPTLLRAAIRAGSIIPQVADFLFRGAYRRTLTLPA
jgi:geranylgeranyl reductase family protein